MRRSARDWAKRVDDSEVPSEEPGLEQIGEMAAAVVRGAALALHISKYTESPIETILGVALMEQFLERLIFAEPSAKRYPGHIFLVPQFKWRKYRIDWSLFIGDDPRVFIECDGAEFHSTATQQLRDKKRDEEIKRAGIIPLRFSGSEIHYSPQACVQNIYWAFGPSWKRQK